MSDTIQASNALLVEVWEIVRKHFYDSKFNAVLWQQVREKHEQELCSKADVGVPGIINRMLSELRTSHTHYYTKRDPEYYQLLSVFNSGPFSRKVKNFSQPELFDTRPSEFSRNE